MALLWRLNDGTEEAFDRLQALILGLREGDAVHISQVADASGLSERACRRSLEALARVGLMTQEHHDRFVRRRLTGSPR